MSFSRRYFLFLLFVSACGVSSIKGEPLVMGTVSYGAGEKTLSQYDRFGRYLEKKTRSIVQLEPAFNENKAIERISARAWSLVFASPGLAAIAISQYQYTPLFPLIGVTSLRSILVVRKDSPIQQVRSLAGKTIALGQPGSATGYYLPIFNLYGLTLAEILFAPTPKIVLETVAEGKAAAGALSIEEFNTYRNQINQTEFRVLYSDPHNVPSGCVLISPTIERNRQEEIRQILSATPANIAQEAGFVTSAPIPDYKYMISVVQRVRSIFAADDRHSTALLQQKPVHLYKGATATKAEQPASSPSVTPITPNPTVSKTEPSVSER